MLMRLHAPWAPGLAVRPGAVPARLLWGALGGSVSLPPLQQRMRPPGISSICTRSATASSGQAEPTWPWTEEAKTEGAAAPEVAHSVQDCLLAKYLTTGGKWTSIAQEFWKHVVAPGDTVIDATCGGGRDTLILARLVQPWRGGAGGRVLAVDVQEEALLRTRGLLHQELGHLMDGASVDVRSMCHSRLAELAPPESVRLVTFNLGFLPGSDKTVITQTEKTVAAVRAATGLICPGGMVSILAYIGHPGGMEEYEAVTALSKEMDLASWASSEFQWLNSESSPRLILLSRKK